MTNYRIPDQQYIDACRESSSVSGALTLIGLRPLGGNYAIFHRKVRKLGIDTSHFTGQSWSKGKKLEPRVSTEVYLNNQATTSSSVIRKRLIREGIFEHRCNRCKNTTWNGQPIAIELEHINGDHFDNTLSNLELLCPNCHAQTSTYKGKNIILRKARINQEEASPEGFEPPTVPVEAGCSSS